MKALKTKVEIILTKKEHKALKDAFAILDEFIDDCKQAEYEAINDQIVGCLGPGCDIPNCAEVLEYLYKRAVVEED